MANNDFQILGEKGVWYIVDKDANLVTWRNENVFTYDEIENYAQSGKQKEKDLPLLWPIFSEASFASQYATRHKLKEIKFGLITEQKKWTGILETLKGNHIKDIVVNPCIRNDQHECELFIRTIDSSSDFIEFDAMMKSFTLTDGMGGYAVNS